MTAVVIALVEVVVETASTSSCFRRDAACVCVCGGECHGRVWIRRDAFIPKAGGGGSGIVYHVMVERFWEVLAVVATLMIGNWEGRWEGRGAEREGGSKYA